MFPDNISGLGYSASAIFSRPASMATAEIQVSSSRESNLLPGNPSLLQGHAATMHSTAEGSGRGRLHSMNHQSDSASEKQVTATSGLQGLVSDPLSDTPSEMYLMMSGGLSLSAGHTSNKCRFRSGIDDDVQIEETIINQKEGVPKEGPISREGATNGTSVDNTKSNGAAEGCSDDVSNPLVDVQIPTAVSDQDVECRDADYSVERQKSWADLAEEGNEEDVEEGNEDDEEDTSADSDGDNNDVVKSPRAVVPLSNVQTNLSITDNATMVQDSDYGRVDVHGAGTAVIVFNSEVDTIDKNLQINDRSLTRVRRKRGRPPKDQGSREGMKPTLSQ
ncbi:hypothetical protein NE237_026637 [Protea cynaroides]|uniref:Uncharacterized protein n=1 Tax=Protea cynaroides TaxID=273540 RepID=A0A9Q0H446_9MAGN|nr:hypothetical protein NE237_026637 [Protea cynaroides]